MGEARASSRNRSETLAALSLGAFFLLLTLGPRVPLDIEVGRRVDLRLHEVLLVPMCLFCAYLVIEQRKFLGSKSPWYPFFGIGFLVISATLFLKVLTSTQIPLLGLGYSYRALVFFLISVTVALIAVHSGPRKLTLLIPCMLIAFFINSAHVVWNSVFGSNAIFTDHTGAVGQLYSPGLVGEPNALGAGIFFLYMLTILIQWNSTSRLQNLIIPVGVTLSFICIYLLNNRSVMVMAAVALVIMVVASFARGDMKALIFACILLLAGLFAFFFVNPRGSSESPTVAVSEGRFPQWQRSLSLIKEDPVLGWELGTNEAHQALLRLWGEWGFLGCLIFLILIVTMLIRSPRFETTNLIGGRYWVKVLKMFISILLVGGLLTDSLTPVISWDLLSFSVGLAWATWGTTRALQPGKVGKESNV